MTVELIKRLGGGVSYMIVSEGGRQRVLRVQAGRRGVPRVRREPEKRRVHCPAAPGPLAELVKIDPKAIGVGQYQHDMPQARLDETLSGVVEDCVNSVAPT